MLKRLYGYLYSLNDNHTVAHNLRIDRLILVYIIYLAIILIIGAITYFLLKNKKGKSAMKPTRFFVLLGAFSGFAILVNFIVNYGVMLDYPRLASPNCDIIFGFITKRENGVNQGEWIRQIFEVASYIPIGLIFANNYKKKGNKSAIAYAIIYATVLSGITELICNSMTFSVFYYQTLVCNLLGMIIGFITFGTFVYLFVKKSANIKNTIMCMIPLALCIVYFAFSYMLYYRHPYGNIYPDYYRNLPQEHIYIAVDDSVTLLDEEVVQSASAIISTDELRETAEKYFSLYGKSIDDLKVKAAPDFDKSGHRAQEWDIVWTDSEEKLIFIAKPCGFIFYNMAYYGDDYFENDRYVDSEQFIHLPDEETRKVLKRYDVNMVGEIRPLSSNPESDRGISSSVDKELMDGYLSWFTVKYEFVKGKELGCLDVWIMQFRLNKDINNVRVYLASPKQAYDKLCQGECYAEGLYEASQNSNLTITVNDSSLEVQRDNWGCLQYVYRFDIEPITAPDGTEIDRVFVPAMKSYY